MKVPIEVSAHHFHATRDDYEALFGQDEPRKVKELSQKGQFASDKIAYLESNGSQIKLRFLGPFRKMTQVEITKTEAYQLKLETPVAECVCGKDQGNCSLGALATLVGPKGKIYKKMVITAQRHVHLSPEDAQKLEVKEGNFIKVAVGNQRRTVFEKVLCRVDPSFTLNVHLDTDEANAAGILNGEIGEIITE